MCHLPFHCSDGAVEENLKGHKCIVPHSFNAWSLASIDSGLEAKLTMIAESMLHDQSC